MNNFTTDEILEMASNKIYNYDVDYGLLSNEQLFNVDINFLWLHGNRRNEYEGYYFNRLFLDGLKNKCIDIAIFVS